VTRSLEDVLASRRMCRDFSPAPLTPAVVEPVLAAAFAGPRAGNTHGLHLVVLEGPETARYWDVTLPVERRATFRWPGLLRAPVLALLLVDPAAYVARYAEPDKARTGLGGSSSDWPVPYWFVDAGSAAMSVLLAAESAGLGALWFGPFGHESELLSALGVPEGMRAAGTLALGRRAVADEATSASARRGRPDPAAFVHRGGW